MKSIITIAALVLFIVATVTAYESCVNRVAYSDRVTNVKSKQPFEYIDELDIPQSWDWRNASIDGSPARNLVTWTRNQWMQNKTSCGSCWAMATTSALGDRIKIQRSGQFPEVDLAPQVLINCAGADNTCAGGDPTQAYQYIFENGIPDETCQPYESEDNECDAFNICRNCNFDLSPPTAKCFAQPTYTTYHIEEHGLVNGSSAMMAEIFVRGPIACGMSVTAAFFQYQSGVFTNSAGSGDINHEVSIVGWGTENGVDYWIGRNSWGTAFGDLGFFKIQRGVNLLNIESDCDWAVPSSN